MCAFESDCGRRTMKCQIGHAKDGDGVIYSERNKCAPNALIGFEQM